MPDRRHKGNTRVKMKRTIGKQRHPSSDSADSTEDNRQTMIAWRDEEHNQQASQQPAAMT
jgi:hypothetical protein